MRVESGERRGVARGGDLGVEVFRRADDARDGGAEHAHALLQVPQATHEHAPEVPARAHALVVARRRVLGELTDERDDAQDLLRPCGEPFGREGRRDGTRAADSWRASRYAWAPPASWPACRGRRTWTMGRDLVDRVAVKSSVRVHSAHGRRLGSYGTRGARRRIRYAGQPEGATVNDILHGLRGGAPMGQTGPGGGGALRGRVARRRGRLSIVNNPEIFPASRHRDRTRSPVHARGSGVALRDVRACVVRDDGLRNAVSIAARGYAEGRAGRHSAHRQARLRDRIQRREELRVHGAHGAGPHAGGS